MSEINAVGSSLAYRTVSLSRNVNSFSRPSKSGRLPGPFATVDFAATVAPAKQRRFRFTIKSLLSCRIAIPSVETMRKFLPHLVLAFLAPGSLAVADEYPYEPIILEDGILLIDKGSGWNWILETGSQQPEQRRSWRQLSLPGHSGHPGQQHQAAPMYP